MGALLPLIGGAYSSESVIADAQRCVNMFAEKNPAGAPVPVTHYPRPGLIKLTTPGVDTVAGAGRGTWFGSNEVLYGVIGQKLYSFDNQYKPTLRGTIVNPETKPVGICDNGIDLVITDGSRVGYSLEFATNTFAAIGDPDFLGSRRIDYMDSFLIFDEPGTKNFYSSESNAITFDPLDIAAKTVYPDLLSSFGVLKREIWLLGRKKSEVWADAGSVGFPFALIPGATFDHGCAADYSIATSDAFIYRVGRDEQGQGIIFKGSNYQALRISTHAIEQKIQRYPTISDAVGMTFQYFGHVFYMVHFPSGDATWVFDEATGWWHEWTSTDNNGVEHRARVTALRAGYGQDIIGLDWETGALYKLDKSETVWTDDGNPIVCRRGFPHVLTGVGQDGKPMPASAKRITLNQVVADMETGGDAGIVLNNQPQITLRLSRDRGRSFYSAPGQSLGATGSYNEWPQWRNLGQARDWVLEFVWSAPVKTALNGAYVDTTSAET